MEEFLQMLSVIGGNIDANVYNVVGAVVILVVLFLFVWVGKRIADNEYAQRLLAMWKAVENEAITFIIQVAYGAVDLTAYETEAKLLLEEKGYEIDPRMLFVVRNLEAYLKRTFNYRGDFVTMHRWAEAIFQKLKANSNLPNV